MPANYHVIVIETPGGYYWTAYTASDADEAEGYADFCRATMLGAKVRVELIEWEEERCQP